MKPELFTRILYHTLKNYNQGEKDSISLKYMTDDPYVTEYNRDISASVRELVKPAASEMTLSSILGGSKASILAKEEAEIILKMYEERQLDTRIEIVTHQPFVDFFQLRSDKAIKLLRLVIACTVFEDEIHIFRNSVIMAQFMKYFDLDEKDYRAMHYGSESDEEINTIIGISNRTGNSAYTLKREYADIIKKSDYGLQDLVDAFFSSDLKTSLTEDHFKHQNEDISFVEKIINKAIDTKKKGTNILFWGWPGTGKTELAIHLAQKNGWNLISVSDNKKDNKEKTRAERVQGLTAAQYLFKNTPRTVLLFDEVEDIFKLDLLTNQSKLFINRIVENSEIPIIWTTNSLMSLPGPYLRRMSYNVEFDYPATGTRELIWKQYLTDTPTDDGILKSLARDYKLTPATIKVVADAVNVSGVTEANDIKKIINKTQKLLNYGEDLNEKKYIDHNNSYYDITAANASLDLEDMKNKLAKANSNFSLCLYGPSGTGKSEYVKYLANQLGYQVLYRRASELLGMYVGQTEKQIAALFKEATDEGKFILIDEGDTFLRDRSGAQRSWEVSQVNEFLSHMEMLQTPLAITTNLFDSMDAAALRRFTFKIKFDFLTEAQRTNLFLKYFKIEAPDYIKKMQILTPGDFANVKRKVDILNITDEKDILAFLDEEIKQKPQFVEESRFGFTRNT